jgi:hypothetical protein
MPSEEWPLRHGRPSMQIVLSLAQGGQPYPRTLLADTGVGSLISRFELILDENDCILCGGNRLPPVTLGGAYTGSFPTYLLRVQVPALAFAKNLRVVAVPSVSAGIDGLACFKFLNRFHYGNFGKRAVFGLEY